MRIRPALLTTLAVLLVAGCTTTTRETAQDHEPDGSALVVDTTTGTVRGKQVGPTRQFRGIRYAQPPTGERRWALPEPVEDTDDELDATTAGSPCPQGGDIALGTESTDEDCLFLDVTTPARDGDGLRPVMVWWHGGGFTSDAGSQYDAQRLADEGDVVVVTANYRLGMLGYLALPDLEGSGNFGLADQIAALQWANDNAEAFGGDPDRVTVFGESAGGTSVCAALTSPAAAGLVDRAAFSSGSCRLAWPKGTLFPGVPAVSSLVPLDQAEATSGLAAKALGCTGTQVLECLRAKPVADLVAQGGSFGNPLAYGTELLPTEPAEAVQDGDVLDVPVLSGGNLHEHRSFIGGLLLTDPEAVTERTYPALVRSSFGSDATAVEQEYPLTAYGTAAEAWSAVVTDVAWACTTTRGARELAAAGNPAWSYEFADETSPDVSGVATSGLPQGAAHATDLPYLFDLGGKDLLTTADQRRLASTMVQVWSSFAHDGEPSADGVSGWDEATADDVSVLQFGTRGSEVVDHRAEHRCGFWETLSP